MKTPKRSLKKNGKPTSLPTIDIEKQYVDELVEWSREQEAELIGLRNQLESTDLKITNALQKVGDLDLALQIAQSVAQGIQEQAHEKIAGVVTNCLQLVFEKPYVFKMKFTRRRGRTEADLLFEKDGMEVDPLTASGGGVVDVAAFALRLSSIVLHKPTLRRTVLLDEPFKFVSEQYRAGVRKMLENLAKDFDMQFLMVTHINELITGKVISI